MAILLENTCVNATKKHVFIPSIAGFNSLKAGWLLLKHLHAFKSCILQKTAHLGHNFFFQKQLGDENFQVLRTAFGV